MAKKKENPLLLDFFILLYLFERHGIITKDKGSKTYCDLCKKSHFKQWYIINRTGERFYICTLQNRIVSNYLEGKWIDFEPLYLINQLISG